MSFMKATYEYTKMRKTFGSQPMFQDVPAHMLDSIAPDKSLQKQYMLRNPVNRQVQAILPQSSHEANTKHLVTREQIVDHTEGGWPRDIHPSNEEHTARYRRRVMHDENYVKAVLGLAPEIQHYLYQNNAIEMYESYFDDMNTQEPVEKCSIRIANVFRDDLQRPVSCVKWTNEKNSKIAVAYSHRTYPIFDSDESVSNNCYLWDVTRQTAPIHKLTPEFSCWQLACSPTEADILIGGLENGTINVFDIRSGENSMLSSSIYTSHRGPVTSLLYCHSRMSTEFFSGSPDGQCIWWDSRNVSKPLDKLMMSIRKPPGDLPTFSNAEGVSSLQFDHGLPTKFLCGTESGLIINVNKMGREHSEKLVSYWDAHTGPVRSVQRSACTFRMFLSCGDSTVRVWSEEVRTDPIIVTRPYPNEVTDAAWAPLRYSSYMVICAGGYFYFWDLLRKYGEPIAALQVAKHELTRMAPHSEGHSVAIGDSNGSLHLIHLSDTMIEPGNHDKALMSEIYNRQTNREHILDNRIKEIRLKLRAQEEAAVVAAAAAEEEVQEETLEKDDDLQETEEEYLKIVTKELSRLEHLTPSSASLL